MLNLAVKFIEIEEGILVDRFFSRGGKHKRPLSSARGGRKEEEGGRRLSLRGLSMLN